MKVIANYAVNHWGFENKKTIFIFRLLEWLQGDGPYAILSILWILTTLTICFWLCK